VRRQNFIRRRLIARGVWIAETALHLGCGKESAFGTVDMPLLRDADGQPFIAGTSIAGTARNALHEPIASLLFGGQKDSGFASLVLTSDAPITGPVAIRDGVRIDPRTGQAFDGAKYDLEVLAAGSSLPLNFTLRLYDEAPEVEEAFHELLRLFSAGRIRFGARTRRGYGQGSVANWDIRELRSDTLAHVKAWLLRNPEGGDKVELRSGDIPARNGFRIEADMRLRTPLLIRATGRRPGDPDFIHLADTKDGTGILAGTSLAGVLRHRCERIANTLGLENVAPMIDSLFGRARKNTQDKRKLRASRVWISEDVVRNAKRLKQGRVKIDRFTGGAAEGALFDEAPLFPEDSDSHSRVIIRVEDPRECEAALLLLAFKDLWLGDLPVGGECAVGRGILDGVSARIQWNGTSVTLSRRESALTIEGDTDLLNRAVSALPANAREWKPLPREKKDDEN
jgi:CRISPR/Cas system CSM-associated protein Csm3 (group 7 of RAMP superfamily)